MMLFVCDIPMHADSDAAPMAADTELQLAPPNTTGRNPTAAGPGRGALPSTINTTPASCCRQTLPAGDPACIQGPYGNPPS